MRCPHCRRGQVFKDEDGVFCLHCGWRLDKDTCSVGRWREWPPRAILVKKEESECLQ